MKRKTSYLALSFFILVFLAGAVMLGVYYRNIRAENRQLTQVLEVKNAALKVLEGESTASLAGGPGDSALLFEYRELYAANPDLVGWVQIDGTRIDYPVMQTQTDYYLTHGFDRRYSSLGLPFADKQCDLSQPSQNIFVYGHNIKSGAMFHDLLQYEDEGFREENPLIRFDTLYEQRVYSVISAMRFIDRDISGDFSSDSDLLVLVTCSYHAENGRFAVVAKKID